ncbi:hypothetical protein QWJ07_16430 [Frankia sp. RB7]|nr:hypothetical protein [Frankia sp. RB7]
MPKSISVIEQARIQAQVLVPLIKALQAELGEARAKRTQTIMQGADHCDFRYRRVTHESKKGK